LSSVAILALFTTNETLNLDLLKLLLYVGFFCVIFTFYGIPLHIIRDLYYTFRSFVTRLADMVQYRRATYNMNERYPDATEAELTQTDRTCIICREDMDAGKRVCFYLSPPMILGKKSNFRTSCPAATSSISTAFDRGWRGSRRARHAA